MPRFEIVAGLDVGTTKVCLAVARKPFESSQPEFLGYYSAGCECLSASGAITDLSKVADAVSTVVEKALDDTKQKFNTAFVNIAGTHIKAENVRGRVNILSKEGEISKKDLDAAYYNAKISAVTYETEPLLVVMQDYIVDNQGSIKNPVGLLGSKLEADYLFITGSTPLIGNLCKAINMAGLEIEELVLSNLANSFAVLTASEKDLGVILIDIGSSITEATIFREGIIRYDKMLVCGAENLALAIASQLKIQPDIAAKIIKKYCKLISSDHRQPNENILLKEIPQPKTVTGGQLQKIIEPKIREVLGMIKDAISKTNYSSLASSGVVLIGGISTMDGLAELAETIFNMPTRVGSPSNHTTAMGLVNYGCQKKGRGGIARRLGENVFKRAFEAGRDFIYDYF